jgi:hypothetical protein
LVLLVGVLITRVKRTAASNSARRKAFAESGVDAPSELSSPPIFARMVLARNRSMTIYLDESIIRHVIDKKAELFVASLQRLLRVSLGG